MYVSSIVTKDIGLRGCSGGIIEAAYSFRMLKQHVSMYV